MVVATSVGAASKLVVIIDPEFLNTGDDANIGEVGVDFVVDSTVETEAEVQRSRIWTRRAPAVWQTVAEMATAPATQTI